MTRSSLLLWPALLLGLGCHSRRDVGLLACDTFPGVLVGPAGSANTLSGLELDTAFARRGRGAVVIAARAADDSSTIGVQATAVPTDSIGVFYQAASRSLQEAAVILELPPGPFHVRAGAIGFVGQSTELIVRRGYVDTVTFLLGRLDFDCSHKNVQRAGA